MNKYAITVLKTNGLETNKDTIFDISKKEWCAKNDVDYIEIKELDEYFIGYDNGIFLNQKYQCIDICNLKGYDKVINLDYDVIVNPNTPKKIFHKIKSGIGITHGVFNTSIDKKDFSEPFKGANISQNKKYPFRFHQMQGGMFFYCKGTSSNLQFKDAENEIKENLTNWIPKPGIIDEQAYITYLLHRYPDIECKSLTRLYNYLPIFYDSVKHLWNTKQKNRHERYKAGERISTRFDAFFIHYCGFKRDLELAEIDWERIRNDERPMMFEELQGWI